MSILVGIGAMLVGAFALMALLFLAALIASKPAEVFGGAAVIGICLYLGFNIFDLLGWWSF